MDGCAHFKLLPMTCIALCLVISTMASSSTAPSTVPTTTSAPTAMSTAAPTVVQVVYQSGTGDGGGEAINGMITGLVPNQQYKVTVEILRCDLGEDDEYVQSIVVNGIDFGKINPDGNDYACNWFAHHGFIMINATAAGTAAVSMVFIGNSYDCDCDTNTWSCSKEGVWSHGRTPMEAAARFTFGDTLKARCSTDTGGTCVSTLTRCQWSNATCSGGKCVCQDGSCSVNGACVPACSFTDTTSCDGLSTSQCR